MTLEEDPDAIWMTGPPPRLPFARAGMRRRVAISLVVPIAAALLLILHFTTWAGTLSPAENGAVLLITVALVAIVLLAAWTSRRRPARRRRSSR